MNDALWNDYLDTGKYKITHQNGKLGLNFKDQVLLEPKYSELSVTNHDVPLPDPRIRKYIGDAFLSIEEWNFPIVQADGKYGLVNGERKKFELEIKYDKIIKLTYDHYLCLEHDTYTLYKFFNGPPKITAVFRNSREIDLPELLNILKDENPEAHAQLSENLYWEDGNHISKFWRYEGSEFHPGISYWHYFPVATRKAILSTSFEVTPLELVWARGI